MNDTRTLVGILAFSTAVTAVLVLYPASYALTLSLQQTNSFVSEPVYVGLDNYRTLLASSGFWNALGRGLVYSVTTILLQLGLGIGFALLLNANLPLKRLVRGVAIMPYLLPTVAVAVTFKWMFDATSGVLTGALHPFGIDYVPWGEDPLMAMLAVIAVSVWIWTPFVTLAVLSGLQSVPTEYYEAAKVDGAGPLRIFFRVTLPQLRPVITVVLLLRAIWMFNKFDVIWLLTEGGPIRATEHLPILAYRTAFEQFDVGLGAAVSVVSFIVLSLVILIYFWLFPLDERR